MPYIHIRVNVPAPPTTAKPVYGVTEINNAEAKPLPATQPGDNTHYCIVVFPPGSNLPPAYVAVVEIIPQNEVNAREAERKVLLTYQDARQRRESVQTDEHRKSHSYQWLLYERTINQRQIEEKQAQIPLNQRIAERQSIQEANAHTRRQAGRVEQFHRDVERTNGTIAALNGDLSRRRQ